MKKNVNLCLIYSFYSIPIQIKYYYFIQLNESNIISANRYEINKLTHFSFSINGCYAIFEGRILAWIPPSQNLYFDSLEFLQYEPIELDSTLLLKRFWFKKNFETLL